MSGLSGFPESGPRRRLLIVAPHFPPINAPDGQRARLMLPHLEGLGWEAVVLAVDPAHVEGAVDPMLERTLPAEVPVVRVGALPARWTRRVGIGNLGLRAFPFLYRAGARLISRRRVDLVFLSTSVFTAMPLARLWKRRFGVPFVLDFQDPWVGDYYEARPRSARPPKYGWARRLNRALEPWTMRAVDGVVAVSPDYPARLSERYPWLSGERCETIPFGASAEDFAIARRAGGTNRFFRPGDGLLHGVYAGVLGDVMTFTCRAICLALRAGLEREPDLFSRVRLHFVGTDYNSREPRATIRPIAAAMGLGDQVHEEPRRLPYFEALRLLTEADFLLVPGSDDPSYTASKIAPTILAGKPLLAVFREESGVVEVMRRTGGGEVVAFAEGETAEEVGSRLLERWSRLLRRLPFRPEVNREAFAPYTAAEMTRRLCAFFDRVLDLARAAVPVG